jgi:DNA processing protein
MSPGERNPGPAGACGSCRRRTWLLARLSAALDYRCGDVPRLTELLALDDGPLLQALAGSRSATLEAELEQFDPRKHPAARGVQAVCRHDRRYPPVLRDRGAPRMLDVFGGADRLSELARGPAAALVGSRRASDYGMEMAKSLARGLAASGVTVVSGLTEGVAAAAHVGVLEVNGAGLAVVGGGLDLPSPAWRRSLVERVGRRGCAVSELPCGCEGRRWAPAACQRTVARLADVTVVVEAGESSRELAGAALARAVGRTVAALPGRVTSPLSRGTNALLIDGAHLVRGADDVLELLHASPSRVVPSDRRRRLKLEPRLVEVLEQVGAGNDTAEKLIGTAGDASEILLALTELELLGLLARGDGGRYVPRDFLSASPTLPAGPAPNSIS